MMVRVFAGTGLVSADWSGSLLAVGELCGRGFVG